AANQAKRNKAQNAEFVGAQATAEPFYAWNEATGSALVYAVRFDIQPRTGLTNKSKTSKTFANIFLFGKTKKLDTEFKGEFQEFRLYRDDQLIQPITPGRHLIHGTSERTRFVDQAFGGTYVYDPAEFMQGNVFRIDIVDARMPNQIHSRLIFD